MAITRRDALRGTGTALLAATLAVPAKAGAPLEPDPALTLFAKITAHEQRHAAFNDKLGELQERLDGMLPNTPITLEVSEGVTMTVAGQPQLWGCAMMTRHDRERLMSQYEAACPEYVAIKESAAYRDLKQEIDALEAERDAADAAFDGNAELARTPATTLAGAVAKLTVACDGMEAGTSDNDQQLIAGGIRDICRLMDLPLPAGPTFGTLRDPYPSAAGEKGGAA